MSFNIIANKAMDKLINDYSFNTVLDIGCGSGEHSKIFLDNNKNLYAIDLLNNNKYIKPIISDYLYYKFNIKFDCIWSSHVLEHQLEPQKFLKKIYNDTKDNFVVAITVPPLKKQIVAGHVSFWNAGLLLYHMIYAGFDCREASILKYDYNISIIVNKKHNEKLVLPNKDYNNMIKYLPKQIQLKKLNSFNGDIERINW